MLSPGTATFKVSSWDEQPYGEVSGAPKLTRASVVITYSGEIEGEGSIEYLMVYFPNGSARFILQERIVGTVAGRTGTCVTHGRGTFESGVAKGHWTFVNGAGTGSLAELRGEGSFTAGHEGATVHFHYTFDYMPRG